MKLAGVGFLSGCMSSLHLRRKTLVPRCSRLEQLPETCSHWFEPCRPHTWWPDAWRVGIKPAWCWCAATSLLQATRFESQTHACCRPSVHLSSSEPPHRKWPTELPPADRRRRTQGPLLNRTPSREASKPHPRGRSQQVGNPANRKVVKNDDRL